MQEAPADAARWRSVMPWVSENSDRAPGQARTRMPRHAQDKCDTKASYFLGNEKGTSSGTDALSQDCLVKAGAATNHRPRHQQAGAVPRSGCSGHLVAIYNGFRYLFQYLMDLVGEQDTVVWSCAILANFRSRRL